MGIYVGDTIKTPEGTSEIEEVQVEKINQHAFFKVFFFANGVTSRVRKTAKDCTDPMFNDIDRMVFKPSEPVEAWTAGEYWDENEECWC